MGVFFLKFPSMDGKYKTAERLKDETMQRDIKGKGVRKENGSKFILFKSVNRFS